MSVLNEQADARRGRPNLSRETKFLGASGDRENVFSPVPLTTIKIGKHTWLVHTLLKVLTIHLVLQ